MTSFPHKRLVLDEEVLEKPKTAIEKEKTLTEDKIKKDINQNVFIKSDPWASALISLYLKNEINPEVEEEHIEEFFTHYKSYGYVLKHLLHMKIAPIQRKNYKWEDYPSKQLRNKFKTKVEELISLIAQFSDVMVRNLSIDAKFVYSHELMEDDFGDVAGFSLKKAKKRKEERSGVSMLFNRSYVSNKETNLIFFTSTISKKHQREWESSSFLLDKIFSIIENYRVFNLKISEHFIKDFVLKNNVEIARLFDQKASVFLGIKENNIIKYIMLGDINLYLFDGENFELVEKGEGFYLGSEVQVINQKECRRVVDLLEKDKVKVKEIDVSKGVGVLIATSNLDGAIRGKRRIRFKTASELMEKLLKKGMKTRNVDSGALFFFV